MNNAIKHNAQLKINQLKTLPSLPEASVKILEAVYDPDISIEQLAAVLALCPGLVARLLGLANSAYFGQSRQIKDLRTAVVQVLGLQLVKSLTVGIVLNVQIDTRQCQAFDTQSFWLHSLLTAVCAQKLAPLRSGDALCRSSVYTGGLLLHIGLLVIAYLFPKELNKLLVGQSLSYPALERLLKDELGVSHFQVGYMLLRKWRLPEVYQQILSHFEDRRFTGEVHPQIVILQASQQMCYLLMGDDLDVNAVLQTIADSYGLPIEALTSLFAELAENKENIQKLADVMTNG